MHDVWERVLITSRSQSITYCPSLFLLLSVSLSPINRGRITQIALRILRNGVDAMKNLFEYVGIAYDMACFGQLSSCTATEIAAL
jgi:hypothetical protein